MTDPRTFQAVALKHGLKLLAKGIKPNSAWTLTNTLLSVTHITGKRYKRSQIGIAQAIADLEAQ